LIFPKMLVFFFLVLPSRFKLGLLSLSLPCPLASAPGPEDDFGLPFRPGKNLALRDECLLLGVGFVGVVVVLPVVVLNVLVGPVGVVGGL